MAPKSTVGAWLKFFPGDWLSSVRPMPLAAKGAYIDLLAYGWDHDLPNDVAALARCVGAEMSEFAPLWETWLRSKFRVDEQTGFLVNDRLEEVREGQQEIHSRRSAAGRAGAQARWQSDSKRIGKGNGKPHGKTMEGQGQGQGQDQGKGKGKETTRARAGVAWEALDDLIPFGSPVREAIRDWFNYRQEIRKPLALASWRRLVSGAVDDPGAFAAKVEHSIAQGYQGLYAPKGGRDQSSRVDANRETIERFKRRIGGQV